MKSKVTPAEFLGDRVLSAVDNLAIRGGKRHDPKKCEHRDDPRYLPCHYQNQQQQLQNEF